MCRDGERVDEKTEEEEEEEEEEEGGERSQQETLGLILELMALGKEGDTTQVCIPSRKLWSSNNVFRPGLCGFDVSDDMVSKGNVVSSREEMRLPVVFVWWLSTKDALFCAIVRSIPKADLFPNSLLLYVQW